MGPLVIRGSSHDDLLRGDVEGLHHHFLAQQCHVRKENITDWQLERRGLQSEECVFELICQANVNFIQGFLSGGGCGWGCVE